VAVIYRIGTAARLSGVHAMTIRNWERRYGVVTAARGQGRQRLYSPTDIDRLRWLREQTESGLSAGEAHALLRDRLTSIAGDGAGAGLRDEARRLRAQAAETRAQVRAARAARGAVAQTELLDGATHKGTFG
jgi:DNA-binding transcriptional MerR regulator